MIYILEGKRKLQLRESCPKFLSMTTHTSELVWFSLQQRSSPFSFTDSLKNHSLSHVNHEKKYERHCPPPFQEWPWVWLGIKQLIYVWIKETPSVLAALAEGASGTATAGQSRSQISPKLFHVNLLLTEHGHLERAGSTFRLEKEASLLVRHNNKTEHKVIKSSHCRSVELIFAKCKVITKGFLNSGISLAGVALKTPFDAIRTISFQLYIFHYAWFTVPPPKIMTLSPEILETAKFSFCKLYTSGSTASWVTQVTRQTQVLTWPVWISHKEITITHTGGRSRSCFFHCWNHYNLCHPSCDDPWAVPRTRCTPVIRVLLLPPWKVRQDFSLINAK